MTVPDRFAPTPPHPRDGAPPRVPGARTAAAPTAPPTTAQALSVRLFMAGLGAAELMTAYLGLRLGLYDALAEGGPATAPQLAERAGIAPRYAREWLEQQAAAGILLAQSGDVPPEQRMFTLPAGHAEALTDPGSLFSIAPLVLLPIGGMASVLPLLIEAFRTGEGIAYERFGPELRGGQAGLNRSVFQHQLAGWIAATLPAVHAALGGEGGVVADVACGSGYSSIALAQAYPKARVHGLDLDERSVADARQNAREAGVADRVTFEVRDAGDRDLAGRYDLVCVFDALHDMARPVEVLRSCRALLAPGGSVLLMEPNVGERFTAPASETERFQYAVSLLHCLPVGMAEQPSAATGTVMRPGTVRAYAAEAGFARVRVLPVRHTFHRLYQLL
ncbi:bifunctional 2-polyprenyl-6-hydroxyphenol methylase/3-demethylubiquinol 3-O-methyltransferase UbiG [Streptomyces sp. NBC_00083]|uniref:class I SAM-dependent methyltransferase n=1 Tax=Streptomyces sp. NBC_00083 TaxID=2975647 RepID=UPI0022580FDA|nr:class I SAM-dependent methyltransferase [Streptomyces sp. NBC_00083]MCX5384765.1 methyltransferase domain-containing protein [Streptomyces sp. NBC_00083]